MSTHLKTLIAIIGIFVGVVVSEKTRYVTEIAFFSLILGIIQIGIYYISIYKHKKQNKDVKTNTSIPHFSIPLASGIFFIAIFVIVLRVQFVGEKNNFVCEKACTFSSTITSSPKIKDEYQIFSVTPDKEKNVYDILVRAPLYPRFEAGEKLVLEGRVSLPQVVMPHQNKKSFDYETYLRSQSIGSEMLYPKIISQTSTSRDVGFIHKLKRMKESFVDMISLYVSSPASALASGMLFGSTMMSQEIIETFRVAGISHIVVLSGFNIAILISFILLVSCFLPLFLRVIIAGVVVILFVIMVDGEVSIIRATLMSFVGLLAMAFGKGYVARQALLLSFLAIIFYEPIHLLHDVSLHLSFLATAGIIYMSDGIKKLLPIIQSKSYQEIITTTFAAYLATLPYSMYAFGTVSLYALLANLIVLPLVPIIMFVTFFVVVFANISNSLSLLAGYVDTQLGNFIIFIAHSVEKLPAASLQVSLSFFEMLLVYIFIWSSYMYIVYKHNKKYGNETLLTQNNEMISGVITY